MEVELFVEHLIREHYNQARAQTRKIWIQDYSGQNLLYSEFYIIERTSETRFRLNIDSLPFSIEINGDEEKIIIDKRNDIWREYFLENYTMQALNTPIAHNTSSESDTPNGNTNNVH